MSGAAEQKHPEQRAEQRAEQRSRRSREEIVREIKLALTVGDGGLLEVERARGFDPYDNRLGSRPQDIWKPRRR